MSFRLLALPAILLLNATPRPSVAQDPGAGIHHEHAPAPVSTSLSVTAGGHSMTFSLQQLQAMPQSTVSVFNAHSKANETYTGPLVATLLEKVGLTLSEATQHDILDSYVIASGTDAYYVVYSGAELQQGLHQGRAIVALSRGNEGLGQNGAFQLIDTLEIKPARWVRNLSSLTVVPVTSPR